MYMTDSRTRAKVAIHDRVSKSLTVMGFQCIDM